MRRFLAVLLFAGLSLLPAAGWARFIDFPYRDAELLLPDQQRGGRLWLPDTATKGAYTLVVLLHGLNPRGVMHPLLGGEHVNVAAVASELIRAGVVRQSFVIAAPTQTANAQRSNTLWAGFDLPHFIHQVERNLPKGIRLHQRPVVMGHSGAGCSPGCGLWRIAQRHGGWVRAMATMDTCMNRSFGEVLKRYLWDPPDDPQRGRTWLINFWQKGWQRDVDGFEDAMDFQLLVENGPRGLHRLERNSRRWLSARVDRDHAGVVGSIFDEALRRLFPTAATLRQLEQELEQARTDGQRERAAAARLERERRKVRQEAARRAAAAQRRAKPKAARRAAAGQHEAGEEAAQAGARKAAAMPAPGAAAGDPHSQQAPQASPAAPQQPPAGTPPSPPPTPPPAAPPAEPAPAPEPAAGPR